MSMRFVFVGNRRFVLEEMLRAKLDIAAVIVVAGTHLENDLKSSKLNINYSTIKNKNELIDLLKTIEFDVLISNGCPYILPISQLPAARYANIHPSCLPDLRGIDPVIGAVLYAKDGGATCHIMDDGIDTGPIISQIRIPYTDDLDVTSMYQLSFVAEQRAFREALRLGFNPQCQQSSNADDRYYSRSPEDRIITFKESNQFLLRKIKAFNNRSQGCEFTVDGKTFRVFQAMRMINPFLTEVLTGIDEGVVGFSYENSIIFRKDGEILRFMDIQSSTQDVLPVGTQLFPV